MVGAKVIATATDYCSTFTITGVSGQRAITPVITAALAAVGVPDPSLPVIPLNQVTGEGVSGTPGPATPASAGDAQRDLLALLSQPPTGAVACGPECTPTTERLLDFTFADGSSLTAGGVVGADVSVTWKDATWTVGWS